MKLAKLFLLVPAFAMLACSGKGGSSSQPKPEPKGIVTEEVFDKQLNGCEFLLAEGSMTFDGSMTPANGVAQTAYIELEDGRYHTQVDRNHEIYFEITDHDEEDDTYTLHEFYIDDGEWVEDTETGVALGEIARMSLQFPPFEYDFKDFTFNEELDAYTADEIDVEFEEDDYAMTNVVVKFVNGQWMKLAFEMADEGVTYAFNYEVTKVGQTHVTFPKVG